MYSDSYDNESRPTTPSEEDCCHNDCNPCIFDVHKILLDAYKKKKSNNFQRNARKNVLHLMLYKNFAVKSMTDISEDYIILSVMYQEDESDNDSSIFIKLGQYVMLNLSDVTRPYTPISWTYRSIDFLIKLYPDGKFCNRLKSTKVGDKIQIRGPYGDFTYKCNSFQQVVMFSIGSGIAAVYPLAKSIIENESEETRVHLICGFSRLSQVPLKKELQNLADYWNFKCTLHISQPIGEDHSLHGINIERGRLDKNSVSKILEENKTDHTLVLICGTDQFNESLEKWAEDMNFAHRHIFK